MLITTLLMLALTPDAAAAKHRPSPTSPPAWSTREGREEAQLTLVRLALEGQNPEGALSLITALEQQGQKSPSLDVLHGAALRELGLFEDADLVLSSVQRRSSAWGEAQNELGLLAVERQDLPRALEHFRAATRANTDNARYLNNLGFTYLSAGQPDEAVEALRRSLSLDSTQLRTRNNLGFSLVATGRDREAFRVFRSGSTEADARYNLGLGRELRGDTDLAVDAYQEALSADPGHPLAREALDRIVKSRGAASAPPPLPSLERP